MSEVLEVLEGHLKYSCERIEVRPFTWYANKYCARAGVQTLAWTFERRASSRNIELASGVAWKSVLTLRLQDKIDEILTACNTITINV